MRCVVAGCLHAWIFHEFPHAGIAGGLVGPFHPGEHHGLVLLRLHGTAEIGELAFGHIVAPALQYPYGTELQIVASKVWACPMNGSRLAVGTAITKPSM